jgi:hypothetical protein
LEKGKVIYVGDLAKAVNSENPAVFEFFNKAKGKT